MAVLDVGCGRGQTVAQLLKLGFDAYGMEASREQARLAREGMENVGEDPNRIRLLPAPDFSYPFEEEAFDVVLSDNVIEHVADIQGFAREISRVTRAGGHGWHIFPSHRCLVEPHVRMPFVHWLPSGRARSRLIAVWTLFGIEAHWPKLDGAAASAKSTAYAKYLEENTCYRSTGEIVAAFRNYGLSCDPSPTATAVLFRLPASCRFDAPMIRNALQAMSLSMHTSILHLTKAERPMSLQDPMQAPPS